MDDLNGLDWSKSSSNANSKATFTGQGNYYAGIGLTATPTLSGRSTPLSAQGSGFQQKTAASITKSATPDSFSNLVSFGTSKKNTLTLQEQQAKLQEENARKEAERRRQYDSQFGHTAFWEGQGKTNDTPALKPFSVQPSPFKSHPPPSFAQRQESITPALSQNGPSEVKDEEDLFAAFNKDAKVDKSSYYPPPESPASRTSTPRDNVLDLGNPEAWRQLQTSRGTNHKDNKPQNIPDLGNPESWKQSNTSREGALDLEALGNDDDPFGLGQLGTKSTAPPRIEDSLDDDDFLGDLGKPVEQVRRQPVPGPALHGAEEDGDELAASDDPFDKAVSELVDMGFSADKSRQALTESGAGLDIQAAVGWLLNDAHRLAKEKSHSKSGTPQPSGRDSASSSRQNATGRSEMPQNDAVPAWMRSEREQSQPRRDDSRSPANSDNDIARTASALGSNLFKTANSLWKTSQKTVKKAVTEFQQDSSSDPSQPKWMQAGPASNEREGRSEMRDHPTSRRLGAGRNIPVPVVTDEALLLEADSRPPRKSKPAKQPQPAAPNLNPLRDIPSREHSPAVSATSSGRSTPAARWQQAPNPTLDARSRLNKQAIDEQSAQAYISPARRKAAAAKTKVNDEPDLLSNSSSLNGNNKPPQRISQPASSNLRPQPARPSAPSSPIPIRQNAPARQIPHVSPSALSSSHQHRTAGTAHFKRGDYASAHNSYTQSLAILPQGHPITIILLCNRSLTALKTGEPKTAVTDADTALSLIGPSRGENESIDLQSQEAGDGKKDMKEFWGKALTRKAEALEQMERWSDAALVWKTAVEAGVGGATAAAGRQRCEKALTPKPATPIRRPTPASTPRPSALSDLHASTSSQSTEAVQRLRAANAAAEKADDEKFALSDSVDARLLKWRDGRKDNLRALLGGMDQVLWEGSGWKKIGLHELVQTNKVKINYMKAIAKVHPDKLPQNATTEQQMISASVFATLNEAWDKFKKDNNM